MTTCSLLQGPKPILAKELATFPRQWQASFFSKKHGYTLSYEGGDISFSLEYYGVFPEGLDADKFASEQRELCGDTVTVYRHEYGPNPWKPTEEQKRIGFQPAYHVAKPLVCRYQCPSTSLADLVDYLPAHRVVFYTGAGLSEAGGVAGMGAFMNTMGMNTKRPIDQFIERLLNCPDDLCQLFSSFCQCAFYGEPTSGHEALKVLAEYKECQIVTENFDYLHERTGVRAFHVEDRELSKDIDGESLSDIDAFVCVCLSYDDRGLLSWYKEQHPRGKIIALNLSQPSYLSEGDMFIQGDAHQLLKGLIEELLS